MLCPLQLWDEFLQQVKLTLNLLRFSRRNPLISANLELYSPFDFNKMPLSPLGTKALVYNNPVTRASWAPHAIEGFYVGPAINHSQCLRFYIPSTHCFHFSYTWRLYPTHCQVPVLSKHDKTLSMAGDIFEQLGGTIPTTTASAKLKQLSAIRQLSLIMSGQPNAPTPVPTAPMVETATLPWVVVAAPPTVATTLYMITALNTIHQLPIVHQRVTRNNNPYQILADDDNDKDDEEKVVASNCSPKTPLPMLHKRHGPIVVPPTIPRPTTHRLQVIQ
jgi:hypothetical protein